VLRPPATATDGEQREQHGLFQDFQRELEALEAFRDQFRSFYGFAGLERDDPDVQRMVEALAFFSARTRREAERALERHERRALEQLFPYLLSPMPSMALLAVDGARATSDARTIPAGTEVLVTAGGEPGGRGPTGELSYRTLRPLRVRPVDVEPASVELRRLGDRGWELRLRVSSAAPQIDPLDQLELHVNPQGDLVAALRLYHALGRCLRGVSYSFPGTRAAERTTRRVSFAPPPDAPGTDPLANPLERFRRFLHFPLAALGLRVPIDASPAEWSALELRFHLDAGWPSGLGVAPRAFLLHVTPMINLVRATAEPVAFDGTRARVEVAHPDPAQGWRPRDLLAVYRAAPGGLVPVPPDSLARDGESYGVDLAGRALERQLWLDLKLPSAFEQPTTIVAEAEWFQPAAARLFEGTLAAVPASRHIERVRWELVRPLQEALDSPLAGRRDRLERLLELAARAEPSAADLAFVLEMLGAAGNELFSRVVRAIAGLEREAGPDARSGSGQRQVYAVKVRRLPPALRPAADLLFARLPELLSAWYDQPSVAVRVAIEGDDQDVEFAYSTEEVDRGQ
jgi:type VI secretion system protein ImpG